MSKYAGRDGVFLTDRGNVGFQCACGFTVIARHRASLEQSLQDHQTEAYCSAWREYTAEADKVSDT